jgi:general secretion pathway protein D
MKQAGLVNTLASPRIRARNKEKAKVLIGQREPVITNSVTPTAAGTPVVTGSVQYLDVGLTLEVQPTVYLDTDVAVKINLEVSSILKQITTASGTIAYEIGTRNANTLLRLKDGETQILAGLIQDSDTRNFNSIPGLGDIPLLGHLFGEHHLDREKSEIVLSITPRIIRMQPHPAAEATEFWYGSESRMRTRPFASEPSSDSRAGRPGAPGQGGSSVPLEIYPAPAGPPVPNSGPQPVNPSMPAGAVSAPLTGPSVPQTSVAVPSPQGLPVNAPPASIAPAAAPPDPGNAEPSAASSPRSPVMVQGPSEAKVGDEFEVRVQLSTQEAITRLRSQLRFDASALQLMNASTGDIVPAAAGSPTVSTRGAGAQLDVTTTADDPVRGSGSLMIVRFKALAPRQSTNIAAMLSVLGGNGAAVGSSSAQPLQVVIQP